MFVSNDMYLSMCVSSDIYYFCVSTSTHVCTQVQAHAHTHTHNVLDGGGGQMWGIGSKRASCDNTYKGGTEFQQLSEMLGRVVQTSVSYHSHIFEGRPSNVYIYRQKAKFSRRQK